MGYTLRDGLSFCRIEDRTLFLDIGRDRYFALPAHLDDGFQRLINGDATTASAAALVRLGLILPTSGPARLAPTVAMAPRKSALECPADHAASASMLAIAASHAVAGLLLRVSSLRAVVARAKRRRERQAKRRHRQPLATADALSRAFLRSNLLVSGNDRCLFKAIALTDFLAWHGHFPHLVFGVRLRPFSAHCWVQDGDVLLSDRIERVGAFKPILVV